MSHQSLELLLIVRQRSTICVESDHRLLNVQFDCLDFGFVAALEEELVVLVHLDTKREAVHIVELTEAESVRLPDRKDIEDPPYLLDVDDHIAAELDTDQFRGDHDSPFEIGFRDFLQHFAVSQDQIVPRVLSVDMDCDNGSRSTRKSNRCT